jgi:DNA-binding response OmpR family regulator
MATRVLVVDDDVRLYELIRSFLEQNDVSPAHAPDGRRALELLEREAFDAVLLDVMMPGLDGLGVLKGLRARWPALPVLMLTAKGDETDRVVGLELGADDYIVKPFSAREVGARIRAVLRRADLPSRPDAERPIEVGEVRLDPAKREVTLSGEVLELSRKEFELLQLLMSNAGSVVTRERAIDEVWDTNWFGSTKTLDVHVSGLRRKLGDDSNEPRFLHTIRGVGFRFSSPEEL